MRLALLFYLIFFSVLNAQLTWESERIEVKTKPEQKSIEGVYKFKNSGKSTITITKVVTSCGCTTFELSKKVYKPGESGEIHAKLTMPPENPGDISKYVYVKTDEPNAKLKKLAITALRPKYLIIDNKYIKWNHNEDPVEKVINIKVEDGYDMNVVKLESSNPDFKVELITIKAGESYQIKVKPPSTRKPIRTLLKVITDYPEDKPLKFNLSARVAVQRPF